MELPDNERCLAVRPTTTAEGKGEVRCRKPAGHVERGDPRHEGDTGMPVYWYDKR